ncbi:hypothetical protein JX266_013562 [Neoarthrinium moseri]|nr:hypothetical protein JX266_013562 [Neoarthrinium moseri]
MAGLGKTDFSVDVLRHPPYIMEKPQDHCLNIDYNCNTANYSVRGAEEMDGFEANHWPGSRAPAEEYWARKRGEIEESRTIDVPDDDPVEDYYLKSGEMYDAAAMAALAEDGVRKWIYHLHRK